MAYQVSILNTPYVFSVNENESILQAAARQNISLPFSCGSGICGVCMSQVVSGEVVYPDGSPLALFESDQACGKALFCVGFARSDLVLDIPEMC